MKSCVFPKSPPRVRRVLNLWPPFLFSGIRITELSDDYRHCRVELKNWPGTRGNAERAARLAAAFLP